MTSIVPSERFRSELEQALAGAERDVDPIETIAGLGAKLILQQALECEVDLFLGRARYERGEKLVGYRNGYEPPTVRTTSGPVGWSGRGCGTRRSLASQVRSWARASLAPTRSRR
jgi:putative transposase